MKTNIWPINGQQVNYITIIMETSFPTLSLSLSLSTHSAWLFVGVSWPICKRIHSASFSPLSLYLPLLSFCSHELTQFRYTIHTHTHTHTTREYTIWLWNLKRFLFNFHCTCLSMLEIRSCVQKLFGLWLWMSEFEYGKQYGRQRDI